MAFPITPILDNFNRADESPIAGSWARFVRRADALRVLSNQCTVIVAKTTGAIYWTQQQFKELEAYMTLTTLPLTGDSVWIFFRINDPTNASYNGYDIEYSLQAGTDLVGVYRRDAAVETLLGANISQDFSAGDGIGAEMRGPLIRVYRKSAGTWSDVSGAGRSDATYKASGYTCIDIGDATAIIEDFGGGEVVGSIMTPSTGHWGGI